MLIRIPVARYTAHPYRIRATYIRHELIRPAVYLDHWALMRFSENDDLRQRFIHILRQVGGTLCLSLLNCVELCRADDPRHAEAVDRLIDDLSPQLFFINAAANLQRALLDDFQLIGDLKMAANVELRRAAGKSGYFKTFWNLGQDVPPSDDQSLREIFDESTAGMAMSFNDIRQSMDFVANVRKANPAAGHSAGWVFVSELVRQPFLNPQEGVNAGDVSDINHALNALHCDYVLLDAGWTSKLNQARPRLDAAGVKVAACYSGKARGLERFLVDLAAYKVSASPF